MYIRQDEWKIKEEEAFHKIFGLIHKSCKNDARHFEIRFIFFFHIPAHSRSLLTMYRCA